MTASPIKEIYMSVVICGFPGVGKSTASKNLNGSVEFHDSDSSLFPKSDFPRNYLGHIEGLMEEEGNKVIFVSTHKDVLQGLADKGINHVVVFPDASDKLTYIARYASRGSPEGFIRLIMDKWEEFLGDVYSHVSNCPFASGIVLGKGQNLSDVLLQASLMSGRKIMS